MGGMFFGESMFSKERDSSKVALAALIEKLTALGFGCIDCQVSTDHLISMGAKEISGEEFDRLLSKVPDVVGKDQTKGWKYLLRGLWWSGLRLGEALRLTWDNQPGRLCVDLTGRRPMLRIPGEFQKSGWDQFCPIAPEFAEFLLAIPEADRRGRVFRPLSKLGETPTREHVSKMIGLAGKKAGGEKRVDHQTCASR